MKPLVLLFFFNTFICTGQTDTTFIPGQLYKINFLTLDADSKDTLPLVLIEVFNNSERISILKSDFNGQGKITICSNKLTDSKMYLKVTMAYYLQDTFKLELYADTSFVLPLKIDPEKRISKENYAEYERTLILDCGTDELQNAISKNAYYRHCDGRIWSFKTLIDNHENLNEWELLRFKKE